METKYTLTRRNEVHYEPDALSHAVGVLLPHLIGRELAFDESHSTMYVLRSAAVCIAWRTLDPTEAQVARDAYFQAHPIGSHPFRKHQHVDRRPAGIAFLYYCDRPWKREGKIEDVVVHPDFRRQGISRTMMEMLMKEAKDTGLTSLQLTSAPKREAANALYTNLGFVCRETNVYQLKL